MNEKDLKNSMFSPENRCLEPIIYSDEGVDLLSQLMGTDVSPRKDFVFNNIDFSTFNLG